MINPRELRIGNWVQNSFKMMGHVIEFNQKTVKVKMSYSTSKIVMMTTGIGLDVDPIPLTHEMLLKCGFIKVDESYKFGVYDTNFVLKPDWREQPCFHFGIESTDAPNPDDDFKVFNFAHEIKYVHQLQNIMFAVTGEELIMSINTSI